ncbi:MAG: hypothetical protein HY718_10720 [Planctomycetes bacterium]|nr:hypothetical protein [Planctomycetota bacterium]
MSAITGTNGVMTCDTCGASIYREHIDRGLAGRWAGHLLCPHCLAEKRGPVASDAEHVSGADEAEGGPHPGRSSTYTGLAGLSALDAYHYKRPLLPAGHGATRLRIFHCKLSEGPVLNLNQQINEWLDMHPDVEVKFAQTTIGTWEGKHMEQHIILALYY